MKHKAGFAMLALAVVAAALVAYGYMEYRREQVMAILLQYIWAMDAHDYKRALKLAEVAESKESGSSEYQALLHQADALTCLNQYDTAADKYQEVVRRISELQKQGLGKKSQNGLSAPDFDKIAVQIKLEKVLKHEQWESSSVLSEMRVRFRR
jgi:hypothetical protein